MSARKEIAMQRVTPARLHHDPELFARLGAVLLRRVYNKRSSRDIATGRTCSEKACSTANAS